MWWEFLAGRCGSKLTLGIVCCRWDFYKIIKSFRLKGTFWGYLIQFSLQSKSSVQVTEVACGVQFSLNIPKNGNSAAWAAFFPILGVVQKFVTVGFSAKHIWKPTLEPKIWSATALWSVSLPCWVYLSSRSAWDFPVWAGDWPLTSYSTCKFTCELLCCTCGISCRKAEYKAI